MKIGQTQSQSHTHDPLLQNKKTKKNKHTWGVWSEKEVNYINICEGKATEATDFRCWQRFNYCFYQV